MTGLRNDPLGHARFQLLLQAFLIALVLVLLSDTPALLAFLG